MSECLLIWVIFHYVNVNMSMNICIRFKVQIFMFSVNIGTYFALTIDCGYSLEAPEYSSVQSIAS